jgi:hypothetical protein
MSVSLYPPGVFTGSKPPNYQIIRPGGNSKISGAAFPAITPLISIVPATSIVAFSIDGGMTWTQRTMPSSQSWVAAAYGNGMYVAVAYGGTVAAYSTDGVNWTASTLPDSSNWNDVVYGPSPGGGSPKFLAVSDTGNNIAAYSSNGINWTLTRPGISTASGASWSHVTYFGTSFVMLDSRWVAWGDGTSWSSAARTLLADSALAASGSVVVGVGSNNVVYSTNMSTWTAITTGVPAANVWSSVAYGNSLFVAVNQQNSDYMTSPDGINWTSRTGGPSGPWNRIIYRNGQFVMIGTGTTKIATSPTGVLGSWTTGTMSSSQSWNSLC